jgi:uncharacterized protein (DUF1697 family)
MSHYITKPTGYLAVGDIVLGSGGMILEVDQPLRTVLMDRANQAVWATPARIVNWDAIVAAAEAKDASSVPRFIVSMVRGDIERGHITEPRWSIQGNDLATWAVEAHPGGADCHFKLEPGTVHGSFACGERR